jgi:hypothetical protein
MRTAAAKTEWLLGAVIVAALGVGAAAVLRVDTWGERPTIDRTPSIDPALVRFEERGSFTTGMKEPRGLAVDAEGRVFVAGDGEVRVFDAAGEPLRRFDGLGAARCLAVAPPVGETAGRVDVAGADRVEVFDAEGNRLAAWDSLGAQAVVTSIVACEEVVFVADAGNRIVRRFDAEGNLLGKIGEPDPTRNSIGFIITSDSFDVALGADGLVYAVNPRALRVEAYTPGGHFQTQWGRGSPGIAGFFGCCNPAHLAAFPDGRFAPAEKGISRVKVYGPGGQFESVVAGPEQMPATAADLAVDPDGRVLVLDPSSAAVRVFVEKPKEERLEQEGKP